MGLAVRVYNWRDATCIELAISLQHMPFVLNVLWIGFTIYGASIILVCVALTDVFVCYVFTCISADLHNPFTSANYVAEIYHHMRAKEVCTACSLQCVVAIYRYTQE